MNTGRYIYLFETNRLPKEGTKIRDFANKFLDNPMTPIEIGSRDYSYIDKLTLFYNMSFLRAKKQKHFMLTSWGEIDFMKEKLG